MVSLRNSYAKANNTITLFSIQMLISMHQVIVTAIVIMADFVIICLDNDCGDDKLMYAHLHLNRKQRFRIVCVSERISQTHQLQQNTFPHVLRCWFFLTIRVAQGVGWLVWWDVDVINFETGRSNHLDTKSCPIIQMSCLFAGHLFASHAFMQSTSVF